MATYLCNVFTTAMLSPEDEHTFRFAPMSLSEARDVLVSNGFEQAVGHPATCSVLSAHLGLDVGDVLIVAQVVIPRLAEGQVLSQEQVENCPIQFWLVSEK